jgi:hypothetical protein
MSDCLYFFPIYLREGKKLSEWSLKFTSLLCQVGKIFYSAKKGPVALQFFLYCADISLELFAACSLKFFPHLRFLRSDTNRSKFTSYVVPVKKENKAFV